MKEEWDTYLDDPLNRVYKPENLIEFDDNDQAIIFELNQ